MDFLQTSDQKELQKKNEIFKRLPSHPNFISNLCFHRSSPRIFERRYLDSLSLQTTHGWCICVNFVHSRASLLSVSNLSKRRILTLDITNIEYTKALKCKCIHRRTILNVYFFLSDELKWRRCEFSTSRSRDLFKRILIAANNVTSRALEWLIHLGWIICWYHGTISNSSFKSTKILYNYISEIPGTINYIEGILQPSLRSGTDGSYYRRETT
jgi:hypothetical protein